MVTNGNEGKKCYLYERVSTSMQVDNYSLDAQEERLRKRADYEGMIIAGVYRDEGRSGKSIEGRPEFMRMLRDIESRKDGISFVLVFKLSRFGRNAADVLTSLKLMQRNGVNLISVDESLDSSKDAGKLMITILSAVAEIERENILAQTMAGKEQKAREGEWNGGYSPYGYKLVDGKLVVVEEEAELIREIFRLYTVERMSLDGIAKRLRQQGIVKNIKPGVGSDVVKGGFIRGVLENPVYIGKIAYGRRRVRLKEGSDFERTFEKQQDYILVDGHHEPIISEDVWDEACRLRERRASKYTRISDTDRCYLLSKILRCPECGKAMYGNTVKKRDKVTGEVKDEKHYYMCKHRRDSNMIGDCTYSKQWRTEVMEGAVTEVLFKLVKDEKFIALISSKIGTKADTSNIDAELTKYEKQQQRINANLDRYRSLQNSLSLDDRHYDRKMQDYEKQIEALYDDLDDVERAVAELKKRREGVLQAAISVDNIYKYLMFFDKMFDKMTDEEKRDVISTLIDAVYIFPDVQPNGQVLKQIDFKFPLSFGNEENIRSIVWDNESFALSKISPDQEELIRQIGLRMEV